MPSQSPKSGKRKISYKGFPFNFDKLVEGNKQKSWRCEKRNQGCKARMWTDLNDNAIAAKCENLQHTCQHAKIRQRKVISTASELASTEVVPKNIQSNSFSEFLNSKNGLLP